MATQWAPGPLHSKGKIRVFLLQEVLFALVVHLVGVSEHALFSLLIYMCCSQLCSHCGWLLLKCSAIGIGFNGAETNCRIAHILGILLMNSCNTDRFLATTVVYGLSTLNGHYKAEAQGSLLNSRATNKAVFILGW